MAFSANNLTSIDVSQNSNLQYLLCHTNSLTSLDVSQNPNLKLIQCSNNNITSLDVSQNPIFDELICYDNQLIELNLQNGNNHNMSIMRCLNNPDLGCIQVDDVDYANNQTSWDKDEHSYYSEDCTMGITDFQELKNFKLSPNPVINTLNLETKNSYGLAHINIYSSLGINIFQTTLSLDPQISLDLSSLSNGVYFIEISSNQGKEIHKIIKE